MVYSTKLYDTGISAIEFSIRKANLFNKKTARQSTDHEHLDHEVHGEI